MSVLSMINLSRRSAGAAALTLGLAGALSAQTLDRSARPVPPPAKPTTFPATSVHVLPNGLRVAIVENHTLPLVAVRAVLSLDSTVDAPGKEGLFALTTAMLREGTTTRTVDQITAAVRTLGSDVTPTRFTTTASSADSSLAIMADLLMHAAFPAEAVERRKAVQVTALKRQLQSPGLAARRTLFAALFGAENANARSLLATEASISSLTRDDVTRFYDEYYRPENVTLAIVGDVRAADMLAKVTRLFGAWPRRGPAYVFHTAPPPAPAPTTIYLIDRPKAPVVLVFVAALGPSQASPDAAALTMISPILGGGTSSRLHKNLREKHGYMYSGTLYAPTWFAAGQPSVLGGSAGVAPTKVDSALIEWISEYKAIRANRPPTTDELANARPGILSSQASQIETVDNVADRLAALAYFDLPFDYDDGFARRVASLTARDLSTAFAAHVDPAHLAIVVMGDRAALEPGLQKLDIGPIVLVDDSGKRIP